jgi:hypothetical protein
MCRIQDDCREKWAFYRANAGNLQGNTEERPRKNREKAGFKRVFSMIRP